MRRCRSIGALVLAGLLVAAVGHAQEGQGGGIGEVVPVDCPGCNSGQLPVLPSPALPSGATGVMGPPGVLPPLGEYAGSGSAPCNCGNGPGCVPGRKPCTPCKSETYVGRFLCGLYECICCPDPCYEPRWYPLADTAFYTQAVRPVIQQRFRYDGHIAFPLPDRNEYLWARADGNGKGPSPRGTLPGEPRVNVNDLKMITEGGTAAVSLIVETTYRNVDPVQAADAAGFADLALGTKTLVFDCELIQVSTLFMTYLPSGNFRKGLGTGHTTLEPSILVGIKLSPTTYLQTQISEWIPLGGDQAYSGAMLHYHLALNQELCRLMPDVPIIATGEFNGWSFQDGLFTDPVLGASQKSSGYTYATLGAGVRLFVCDRIDFGAAASFAVTQQHFARDLYTLEFRVRF